MDKDIKIGEKCIGGNNPCFVIAEGGVNHKLISENKFFTLRI